MSPLQNAFGDLALDATVLSIDGKTPAVVGTWGYSAGTSGTVTLSGSKRVLTITAVSTSGGSVTIDGGDAIPIPANFAFSLAIDAQLIDAVFVFSATDSYFVSWVA